MEKKTQGRPQKPERQRKRLQYSVWVSAEEKLVVDRMIEAANLPASQFFLAQVIDRPVQRPRKKNLSRSVAKHLTDLGKLSGLLALAVLKTKDKDVAQSQKWQRSSQAIKWISELVGLYIFEDFDFPKLQQSLRKLREQSYRLHFQLSDSVDKENKVLAGQVFHLSEELLKSFESHYQQSPNVPFSGLMWEQDFDVHEAIESLKTEILER